MKKLKKSPKILRLAKETIAVLTSGVVLDAAFHTAPIEESGLPGCESTTIESAGTSG